ncbi:uncharacterized protein LOC142897555 [Nelusetta ayraudi]|uniref:uncharacterized protein LOC142897555 n=1 Tax=Nelusetta ayraudi TaxID=303726 RepID=UPI003F7151DA
MPKTRHLGMGPALDTCFAAKVKQEIEEEELDSVRAQEKDRLTNVLGLMKTVLLPRLGDLIEWRQKKRLRKPKPTNYSLIKTRKPHSSVPGLSTHPGVQSRVPPTDRSMRSQGATPDVFLPSAGVREHRRFSRTSQGRSEASEAKLRRTQEQVHQPVHQSVQRIKTEPMEPVPVGPPFSDPPLLDRGKRQSKPPNKLLDSDFLFSFCQPAGGAMAVMKKEENMDICLTPSDSQARGTFAPLQHPRRTLRARRSPAVSVVKTEREERSVSQSLEQRLRPKSQKSSCMTKSSRGAAGRARPKQLRGPQNQVSKVSNLSHSCLQCEASYKDCEALVMHRLRHVEGKHWPCPLCCKKFFRMRNVRSHIRTHEPKLYKCRSCIVAGL